MSDFKITINDEDQQYRIGNQVDATLLHVMRQAGLEIKQPCRNGVCGLCRCQLVKGDVTYQSREPHGLWERDIEQGYILPCIAYAQSDLLLDKISKE